MPPVIRAARRDPDVIKDANHVALNYYMEDTSEPTMLFKQANQWSQQGTRKFNEFTVQPKESQNKYATYEDYYSQCLQIADKSESLGMAAAYMFSAAILGLVDAGYTTVKALVKQRQIEQDALGQQKLKLSSAELYAQEKDAFTINIKDGAVDIILKKDGKILNGQESTTIANYSKELLYDFFQYNNYEIIDDKIVYGPDHSAVISGQVQRGDVIRGDDFERAVANDNEGFKEYMEWAKDREMSEIVAPGRHFG